MNTCPWSARVLATDKGLILNEERLIQILQAIDTFVQERGYAPSVREIGLAVGMRSPATVHQAITVLKRRGWAVSDDRIARSLRITTEGREWISS